MLSGADKTALLLLLLDEPEAAGLLARLEPHEVEQIGRAMLNVADASPHTIDQVLGEVLDAAREIVAVGEGAPTVRDLLGRALGDERAGGILERLGEEARAPLFEQLAWQEPWAIATLLEPENPQVQAFVLASLPAERAAPVLARLPDERQLALALSGGDDYELLFTASPVHRERIAALAVDDGFDDLAPQRIGTVVPQPGIRLIDAAGDRRPLAGTAFDHFASGAGR